VVEPVIGNYNDNMGFREFFTRGLKPVRNEFNLVCTAANLRKIWIYLIKRANWKENRNKWTFPIEKRKNE
jgi:transposase